MIGIVVGGLGTVLLFGGLTLATIGLYGMLRRPAILHQLHAAGLITGPAVLLILLASVATGSVEIVTSAALMFAFLLVTSPLSSHAIAQAALRRGVPADPEATGTEAPSGEGAHREDGRATGSPGASV